MSKLKKAKDRFWKEPSPTDYHWRELQRYLKSLGYEEKQGDGSRVKFSDPQKSLPRISLHKRHPDPTLLEYQLREVKEALVKAGVEP